MNFQNGSEAGSDPVFDRLPPKVKREFLEKRLRDDAQAEGYRTELRNMCIKGAIIACVIGFALGLLMGLFSFLLAAVLGLAEAGAGYLVVNRKLGHFASMGLFAGPAIILPFITGTAVFSAIGFVFLLSGWGMTATTGGFLGYWARTHETRFHSRLD